MADYPIPPAYVLSVADASAYGGYERYLECGECDDIVVGIEPGDSLPDLLRAAQTHYDLYHRELEATR